MSCFVFDVIRNVFVHPRFFSVVFWLKPCPRGSVADARCIRRGCGVMVDPHDVSGLLRIRDARLDGFKQVNFRYGMVHASGGHLTAPMPMTTKLGLDNVVYAKMSMSESWLSISTTGTRRNSPNVFGESGGLLELLKDKVMRACDGDLESDCGDDALAEHDPMDDVECEEPVVIPAIPLLRRGCGARRGCGVVQAPPSRKRYPKLLPSKRRVVTVDLPEDPPEIVRGPGRTRTIQLMIVDRRQVWLRLSDIGWAIKYLYTQHMFKGVPLVPDDSEGPGVSS